MPQQPAEVTGRARLLGLQREAVSLLKRAAQQDAAIDDVRRALLDAGQRLEALGAEPDPRARPTPRRCLDSTPALRDRAAARGARARRLASQPDAHRRVDTGPFLALARARARAARGRGRAGLEPSGQLQPDRSRRSRRTAATRRRWDRRRPTVRSPGDAAPSPVTFEEAARLPTRTYCGGADEGPHPGIRRRRRRASRLRRRRPSRHLSGHRRRAHAGARAHPASERALSQPRRMEVRGRVEAGGRGRGGLGQRRVRRRCRRRRASRSLRHELGPELPVPQPRRRRVRGGRGARRRGGRRLEHRLHVLRRGRRRRPGPVRRALRRDDLGRGRARAADARLAQRAAHHGRPRRPARRGRSVLREPRQRPLHGGHRGARPLRCGPRLRLRRRRDRLRRRRASSISFVANDSNPNFLYRNLGNGRFESVGLARRRGGERRRAARRRGWAPTPATTTATARMDLVAHGVRPRSQHALSQRGRPAVRGRERGGGAGRPDVRAHGLGHGVPRRRSRRQAGSVLRQRPHLRGHRQATRSSGKRTVRRTSSCSISARASATSRSARAAACRSRASAAASPSAISTTTATPTSSSATWTMRPRCSRTASAPDITGSAFRVVVARTGTGSRSARR